MEGFTINIKNVEINERIRDRQVRLIDEDGAQLGIVSIQEAMSRADRKNLDLVKISPSAVPPVCKIMDFGKFKFDTQKREKEARKNQKVSELKEVWLSMTIDKHDLETKAKQARKFLAAGDKVKVSIRMRGRQQAHASLGVKVMDDFFALCEDLSAMDKRPQTEGRHILMILNPKIAPKGSTEKAPEQKEKPVDPKGAMATAFQKAETTKPAQKPAETTKPVAKSAGAINPAQKPAAKPAQKPAEATKPAAQKPAEATKPAAQKPAETKSAAPKKK